MNFESLRNKFQKLREDWAEDSHVDFQFKNKEYSADLGQLALDIPFQHNKYLNHYTDISQIKTSLEFEIRKLVKEKREYYSGCLLYTSPSPRDGLLSRMPSSA